VSRKFFRADVYPDGSPTRRESFNLNRGFPDQRLMCCLRGMERASTEAMTARCTQGRMDAPVPVKRLTWQSRPTEKFHGALGLRSLLATGRPFVCRNQHKSAGQPAAKVRLQLLWVIQPDMTLYMEPAPLTISNQGRGCGRKRVISPVTLGSRVQRRFLPTASCAWSVQLFARGGAQGVVISCFCSDALG